ncbi:MAG: ROK family protein [Pseudomonadota bacterium]
MTEPVYAAIEAGGTKFVCALAHGDGTLLERTRFSTRDPHETLAEARAFFDAAATRHGKPRALGIAGFGPLELDPAAPHYGRLLRTPKPGWHDADLLAPFATLDIPIALDTDVNAAALAEAHWGAGRDRDGKPLDSVVYVTVGTGIGGGAVLHGRTLRGLLHPELGHIHPRRHPLDRGFAGICPYHGDCLEGLANGPAIVARLGHELGEAAAEHPIWDIEADYLGQLCAQLALTLSPQRIVLGGGVMQHARLFAPVRERTRHWLGGYLSRHEVEDGIESYIVPPGLGDRSGILGALRLAMTAGAPVPPSLPP